MKTTPFVIVGLLVTSFALMLAGKEFWGLWFLVLSNNLALSDIYFRRN